MVEPKAHNGFAAIPERAIGDGRLTGSHFRVLAAIAFHDRMSAARKQGAGCYASNKTLSEKCNINYSNFSTVVRQLGLWGYIVSSPHPINKRTRVYRVIYGDADDTLPTGKSSAGTNDGDNLPTGKVFDRGAPANAISPVSVDDLPEGEESAERVCPPTQQAHENIQQPNDNYIPLNGKKFCETEKYSAEAAPMVIGEGLRARRADDYDGKYLAIVERALRDDGLTLTSSDEHHVSKIMDGREPGDPLYHQAERILINWGTP